MSECKNCGKEIVFHQAPEELDTDLSYWSHPEGQTVWCYMDRTDFEQWPLSRVQSKAAPAEVTG